MTRLYKKLRGVFRENDYNYGEIATEVLHRSIGYVSERMLGKRPWSVDDMWVIMRYFDLPAEKLHEYFPPDGLDFPTAAAEPRRKYKVVQVR